jgi:hypothetical protein
MALTAPQKALILADINADPALSVLPINDDACFEIANIYNTDTAAYFVWKSAVSVDDYKKAIVWTEVDGLTTGRARIWEWITGQMTEPYDASSVSVRAGLANAWAANTETRPLLIAASKRLSTRLEQLLATGVGSDASPANMGFEGDITYREICNIRNI